MRWFRSLINPLFVFIGIQLVWIVVVVGWLYWFLNRHRELRAIAEKYKGNLRTMLELDYNNLSDASTVPVSGTLVMVPGGEKACP